MFRVRLTMYELLAVALLVGFTPRSGTTPDAQTRREADLGLQSLVARGWMDTSNGTPLIDPRLSALVGTVLNAETVLQVCRWDELTSQLGRVYTGSSTPILQSDVVRGVREHVTFDGDVVGVVVDALGITERPEEHGPRNPIEMTRDAPIGTGIISQIAGVIKLPHGSGVPDSSFFVSGVDGFYSVEIAENTLRLNPASRADVTERIEMVITGAV